MVTGTRIEKENNMAQIDKKECDQKLINLLNRIILKSLLQVYLNDEYLIDYGPDKSMKKFNDKKHHVGERPIVFRYAYYMQNEMKRNKRLKEYYLDCEFNRNTDNPKRLLTVTGTRIIP